MEAEGLVLRKMRLLAGFSQEKMAQLMNVSRSTISRYENGNIAVTLRDAKAWAMKTDNQDMLVAFIMTGQQIGDVVTNIPQVVSFILPFVA